MSNVLIGIIGVILFIGLALAGALILGDDFKSANSSSKAASVVSTMQQVAQAANMYQLKRGTTLVSGDYATTIQTLVDARSLKTPVVSPFNGSAITLVNYFGGANSLPGMYFYTNLGTDDAAKRVCRQIEESMGNPDPDAAMTAISDWETRTRTNKRMGCLLYGYYTPAMYQAYIPL